MHIMCRKKYEVKLSKVMLYYSSHFQYAITIVVNLFSLLVGTSISWEIKQTAIIHYHKILQLTVLLSNLVL